MGTSIYHLKLWLKLIQQTFLIKLKPTNCLLGVLSRVDRVVTKTRMIGILKRFQAFDVTINNAILSTIKWFGKAMSL